MTTTFPMTLEQRADCIADLAGAGTSYRGEERRRRVRETALLMLKEAIVQASREAANAKAARNDK